MLLHLFSFELASPADGRLIFKWKSMRRCR